MNPTDMIAGAALSAMTAPFLKGLIDPERMGKHLSSFIAENARAVAQRAKEMVDAVDAEAIGRSDIKPKHLLAIVEGASLEDDPELRERWAALLANEILRSGSRRNFAALLRELTPVDARVLDRIAGRNPRLTRLNALAADKRITVKSRSAVMHEVLSPPTTLASWDVDASLDNLARLGLIAVTTEMRDPRGGPDPADAEPIDLLSLTVLGLQFIGAIRPPQQEP